MTFPDFVKFNISVFKFSKIYHMDKKRENLCGGEGMGRPSSSPPSFQMIVDFTAKVL